MMLYKNVIVNYLKMTLFSITAHFYIVLISLDHIYRNIFLNVCFRNAKYIPKKKNSNQSMKSAYSKLYAIKNVFKPLKITLTITVLMALVVVVTCRNTQLAKINSKKCNLRNDTKTKHFFFTWSCPNGAGRA